jgi:hypothetical protein
MPVQYACTLINKEVAEDNFNDGEIGNGRTIMHDRINIVANSFADLMKAVGERYGLDIKSVSIPPDEDDGDGVRMVMFHRQEDEAGDPPSGHHTAMWKEGNAKQYAATYEFLVEKRTPLEITRVDIEASGITIDS